MAKAPLAPQKPILGQVVPLPMSDAAVVHGLWRGEPWASEALYDRYAPLVLGMLRRLLGHERHVEFEDVLHEVFVEALASVSKLRDPVALVAWLQRITVHTAYRTMRRRRARRWLQFFEPEALPEPTSHDPSEELRQAVRSVYEVLERMPAEEHLTFSLRYVEGLELTELALATGTSLSTAKRRVAKAEARFSKLASQKPSLCLLMEGRMRWTP